MQRQRQRQRQRHSEESEAWALSETIEDRGANVPTAVHFLELYQTGNGSQEGHCYLAQWHGLQENPLSIVPPRQNNLQLSRHLHPRRQKRIRAVTCSLIRSERRRCKHLFMRLAVLIQPYCPWISPAVEKRRDLQKSLGGHSEARKEEKEKELRREEKRSLARTQPRGVSYYGLLDLTMQLLLPLLLPVYDSCTASA